MDNITLFSIKVHVYCNNTKLQLIYADVESSPEPNEDPLSTEDPSDPTPVDADDNEQVEVEPPTAAEIVQAGVQRGDLSDEGISVGREEIDEVEEQLVQQHVRATAITIVPILQINLCRKAHKCSE